MSEDSPPSAASERPASIHASALLVGPRAVVIRGPSGSGKSSLTLTLLHDAAARGVFARLIGDDRVRLTACAGRLVVRGVNELHGYIELRGRGILQMPYEPAGVVALVVDLVAGEPPRYPQAAETATVVGGVRIPLLAVAGYGVPRSQMVLTALLTPGMPAE
ncbi:MAG: hypothetical protein P4L82_22460 [Ancalomicrobiaceae bacterium]|nr:hypothetical protein [Ancalomicrobiaceae bacterium]